ncbi:MAG TPA: 8-oxo-dGTP diphosphatase [Bacillaceae bacterium]|nr:8-oxo-dGTP diphosphatase [Paenibacillus bovis]HLU23871.1 8-oxo-dGTP diphosphatase [Bacillaceae bacterium]
MYKYTICFIRQGDNILLLNRENPEWMGIWNGVGGKIDAGETPLQCILREVEEETGIVLDTAEYKGIVSWISGGMYVFVAELPDEFHFATPVKTDEGILDWKKIDWILHPHNQGMANLKYFLPAILNDPINYEHRFTYEGHDVIDFEAVPLGELETIK